MLGEDDADDAGAAGLSSVDAMDLGGQSLFSLASSFAGSPAIWDETLELRGTTGVAGEACRFPCCSKRPMRLATLWRGLSSGRGLSNDGVMNCQWWIRADGTEMTKTLTCRTLLEVKG
jgi:hypothetical protein